MTRYLLMAILVISSLSAYSQDYTVESYIDEFKHIAIEEMEKTGIPASIKLAQGILESRFGNSELSLASNNHFGIKCHNGWEGKRYYYDDDHSGECFRVYKNPEQSFRDHSEFLATRSRYEFLFGYASTDYENWAKGLKQAGYATNPKYPQLLIDLIEKHQLYIYDRPGNQAYARNNHASRNDHHQVSTNKDYRMHDNAVHNRTSVDAGSVEAIFSYNQIRTVAAGKYDDIRTIAERYMLAEKRLLKYNDLKPGQALAEGQFIYLQPKRGRSSDQATHLVQEGQTMWFISQKYGVKLEKLRVRNYMTENEEPAAGAIVSLNRKAVSKPAIRKVEPGNQHPADQVEFEMADAGGEFREVIPREAPAVTNEAGSAGMKQQEGALAEGSGKAALPTDGRKVHTVKKGDTLYSISKLYSVTLDDLVNWNKLGSNVISIDQALIVSE